MIINSPSKQKSLLMFLAALLFSGIFISSCSKDDNPEQHYFNYMFNNKSGGSTAVNGMTLANMFFLDNGFTAQTENGSIIIYASHGGNCNEAGKPACYEGTIVVPGTIPGNYILGQNKQGGFHVAEFLAAGIEQYSCDISSPGSDNMTVVISEVGAVGGLVVGTYSGTIGGVQVSGNFKVERLS